jgi:hypothetical protein
MGARLSLVSVVVCVAFAGACRDGSSGGTGNADGGGTTGAAGGGATTGAAGTGTGGGSTTGAAGAAGTTGAAGSAGSTGIPASGLFGAATKYAVSMRPTALAAGDVNGDGRPDLVTGSCDFGGVSGGLGLISVFINTGNGTFAPAVPYMGSASPFEITVGDLDGDGRRDIAVANNADGCTVNEGGDVTVLLNQGPGTFAAARHHAPGARPHAIAASDLDGDGDNDLAVANFGSGSEQTELLDGGLTILVNPGNGVFGAPRKLSAGIGPTSVAAGDLDGDGDNDLAVSNFGYSGVGAPGLQGLSVFRNDGHAAFTRTTVASLYGPEHVALADVDGDRDLDMLVVSSSGISLVVGAGNGTFTPPTENFAVLVGGSSAVAPDIDGDGKLDVVVSGWAGTHTLIGNGSGGFAAQAKVPVPTGEAAGDVVAGDFDGDGKPDVAFVTDQGLYVAFNGR